MITRHYAYANISKRCSFENDIFENGVYITTWQTAAYGEIDVFSPSAHKLHLLRTWYDCNYDSISGGNDTTNFTLGTCIHNLTSTVQCLNYAERLTVARGILPAATQPVRFT